MWWWHFERKTLDKEENEKQSAKDNKVHPLYLNQEVEENVEDDTSIEQTGPRWNIYEKFPSFWHISDDGCEDDTFDHAYPYEGWHESSFEMCSGYIHSCFVSFLFMLLFFV